MRNRLFRVVAAALLVGSACTQPSTGAKPVTDRNVLTQEQFASRHFSNVYEAVEEFHSPWLSTRGTDSFSSPSEVKVYLDNTLMGGIETLKSIPIINVVYVRHYDGPSATSRWGTGHAAGVIYVSTHATTGNPHE